MIKKRYILIPLFVLSLGVLIIAALGYYFLIANKLDHGEVVFAATEVGTPVGDKVTKDIGPAGGTLASADGRLTLSVPPNALTEMLAFSIQPITNKAEGGFGLAYRLEPNGAKFATPLKLSLHYDEKDLDDTFAENLAAGYQDDQKAWHVLNAAVLDRPSKSLVLSVAHFTDWSFLKRLRLSPASATLHVGESMIIEITGCLPEDKLPWLMRQFPRSKSKCYTTDGEFIYELPAGWLADEGTIDNWQVLRIVYTAPPKKPTPNIATVSYPYVLRKGDEGSTAGMFTAHITILDRGYRASGQDGPTSYAGFICDGLDEPFTLAGNNPLVPYPIKFFPTNGTSGELSFRATWKGLVMSGTGTYTVEGADTEKPRILAQVKSTLTGPGGTTSGGGPAHIDLTPLTGNECRER